VKKNISHLITAFALAVAASGSAQSVVQDWFTTSGAGAASGNTWLDAAHRGRDMTVLQAGAAGNTRGVTQLVVIDNDKQQPLVPGGNFQFLNAATGAKLATVPSISTGDGTIPVYRVAASSDGRLFYSGFGGTIRMMNDDQGNGNIEILTSATLTGLGVTGNSRGMDVIGDVSAGTAKLFITRGGTSPNPANVAVFQNSAGTTTTFTHVGTYTVAGYTTDIADVAAADANNIYVSTASSTAPNNLVKKVVLTYSPSFSGTQSDRLQFGAFVKPSLAASTTYVAIGEGGGAEDGTAIATDDGASLLNINPAAGLDSDADNVYDAGPAVLNCQNTVPAVAIDRVTNAVYGYSGTTGTPTVDVAGGGGIYRIHVAAAGINDWALF
jgi:hypothetical protein